MPTISMEDRIAAFTPAERELFANIAPIADTLKTDTLPEMYVPGSLDERDSFPLNETVFLRPQRLSISENRWCALLISKAAGKINRHYHPQEATAYTISGKWGYLEHDWIATAGDFVYEPPGESHTLIAYETSEPTVIYADIRGPLIWLDDAGNPDGFFDVFTFIEMARNHYEKVGLGRDHVNQFLKF